LITELLDVIFISLTVLIIAYLIRHYIFTVTVLRNSQKISKASKVQNINYEPTVSILIPARNEEHVIGRILRRMTELSYPKNKMQVIVIDDASTDGTPAIAEHYSKTYNYINVVHRSEKEGGRGKASALNAGFKNANGEIIFCFDADYYPQGDIIEKLVNEFVDPQVGVVQSRIVVLNEPENIVTRLVALERIGGYCVDQQARNNLGLVTLFGGTAGAIRRSLLEHLGGWDESMLAEDTDLTFSAYLAGYKVRYVHDVECYEEAVENWQAYWRQRYRWAKGHMQCAFKHTLNLFKSQKLNLKQKIDAFFLLNIYFLPVLIMFSLILSAFQLVIKASENFNVLWTLVPISLYSFVGNFAPFFEVGIGTYLDGRTRAQWLIPLLIFTFLYNIPICTKALSDLLLSKISGRKVHNWVKTVHTGNGNCYI